MNEKTQWNDLSVLDRRIVMMVAEGHSNESIASFVNRKEKTVRGRLTAIYRALGIESGDAYSQRVVLTNFYHQLTGTNFERKDVQVRKELTR
jgi:DNA-binding NarL/FixJ family response regulator